MTSPAGYLRCCYRDRWFDVEVSRTPEGYAALLYRGERTPQGAPLGALPLWTQLSPARPTADEALWQAEALARKLIDDELTG